MTNEILANVAKSLDKERIDNFICDFDFDETDLAERTAKEFLKVILYLFLYAENPNDNVIKMIFLAINVERLDALEEFLEDLQKEDDKYGYVLATYYKYQKLLLMYRDDITREDIMDAFKTKLGIYFYLQIANASLEEYSKQTKKD